MPQFTWTGRDERQVVRSGVIEAASARQALRLLARASLAAVAVIPLPYVEAEAIAQRPDLSRLSPGEWMDALRQLVHLLRQGVDAGRACAVAGAATPHAGLSESLHRLSAALRAGEPLPRALGAYPELFDPLAIGLIRSGEAVGTPGHGWTTFYQYLDFENTVCPRLARTRWHRLHEALGWTERLPPQVKRLQDMTRLFGWLALCQRAGLSLDESLERAAARLSTQVRSPALVSKPPVLGRPPSGAPLVQALEQARRSLRAGEPLGAAMTSTGLAPLEARPLLDHAQAHATLEGTLAEMARQYQKHLQHAARR